VTAPDPAAEGSAADVFLDRIARLLFGVAMLAGFAMMAHVSLEVLMRTAFNAPMSGTYETVASYYMIAACFLPWAWLAHRDQHISAEIFTERLSDRAQTVLRLITSLLTVAYMTVFIWQSWVSAGRRLGQNEVLETPTGFLIVWPGRYLLPVAGAAMLAAVILRMWSDLRRLRT